MSDGEIEEGWNGGGAGWHSKRSRSTEHIRTVSVRQKMHRENGRSRHDACEIETDSRLKISGDNFNSAERMIEDYVCFQIV